MSTHPDESLLVGLGTPSASDGAGQEGGVRTASLLAVGGLIRARTRDIREGTPADWEWLDRTHLPGLWLHTHVAHDRYCIWTTENTAEGLHTYVQEAYGAKKPKPPFGIVMRYSNAERAREGHLEACYAWDREGNGGEADV